MALPPKPSTAWGPHHQLVLQQVRECGAATQAATVWDWDAGVRRPSTKLRECLQCHRRCEQAQKEGSTAAGTGAGSSGVPHPGATTTSWVPDAPGPECCLEPVERLLR